MWHESSMTMIDKFVYYTECQFATLERLQNVKRTSGRELARQENIANGMLTACREGNVSKDDALRLRCPRVAERIEV